MPPLPEASRRGSRANNHFHTAADPHSRDKVRSGQSSSTNHSYNTARRGSSKPDQAAADHSFLRNPNRPGLAERTYSAPLVPNVSDSHTGDLAFRLGADQDDDLDGQDEDEVAGVVGAIRSFQPFQHAEVPELLPEINIAVIGAEGVGKSTFVQKALDLPHLPPSQAAECKIPIDGSTYLVRLLELPLEEIDIEDDDTISWPDTIEDKMMPRVDGALALYDVRDKESIQDLPEMLNAITKASLPTVLVSCKCDIPHSQRQIDPAEFEFSARRAIRNIGTLQTSRLNPENHKRGVFNLIKAIINDSARTPSRSSSVNRRRTQSNAVRSVSPRPVNPLGHSRAASDFTGGRLKDLRHSRHDSSNVEYGSGDHLRVPGQGPDDPMPHHSSFLLEESPSEHSAGSERPSLDGDEAQATGGASASAASLSENGTTFDELVDRLLAQPTSKADTKFAAVFLALYRKFAAPGRLLEALVERFDVLEREESSQMIRTMSQLRYMAILEQWVSSYPGDFAFLKTKRRLRVFASKLAETRIFAVAAKEIGLRLEAVQEDDDTDWAYSDRNRETSAGGSRGSLSSTASTLIDDPMFSFKQELSGSTLGEEPGTTTTDIIAQLKDYNQMLADVTAAQRQAELLQAIPRNSITKVQWRAMMDFPDDLIAKELTRIDWIMFLSIRPRDLVRHISLQKEQMANCKNIKYVNRMAEHFNQLASWVANYVLLRDKPKHRAMMLEKFMRVARKLREMNNYNALGAIIAGVKSSSIHRLAVTRDLIPPSVGRDWLKLDILMAPSRSHFAYRLAWENSSSERIPYLPLHRRDLVTAEEGNKSFIGDEQDGRINWKKFEIMGDVMVSLQRAQSIPYRNLGPSASMEQIRELILDVKLVKDEEDLYERSLQCEPAAGSATTATAKFMDFFKR